jgi:hypothetical protein
MIDKCLPLSKDRPVDVYTPFLFVLVVWLLSYRVLVDIAVT